MAKKSQQQDMVLNYIYDYAYARVHDTFAYLRSRLSKGTSLRGTKVLLEDLEEKELIEHKLLPDKQKAYYLTKAGVQAAGRDTSYTKRITKNLNFRHIEHFWIAKKFEESIRKDTERFPAYCVETLNEFTDVEGKLTVKQCNLRSDLEIVIRKNFEERLALRVEIDMGTQGISSTIKMKLDNYGKLYRRQQVLNDYDTWPMHTLFVTGRQEAIVSRLRKHDAMPKILFLPINQFTTFLVSSKFKDLLNEGKCNAELRKEIQRMSKKEAKNAYKLSPEVAVEVVTPNKNWVVKDGDTVLKILSYSQKNLLVQSTANVFTTQMISNAEGEKFSLQSLIKKREPLLQFKNAVDTAKKDIHAYDVVCKTIHSSNYQKDPFFPSFMYITNTFTKFVPHGYVKIRKKQPGTLRDSLFILLLSVADAKDLEKVIVLYKNFLSTKSHMEKINALPIYYGLGVLLENDFQVSIVKVVLESHDFLKDCTRIVFEENCTSEKIFTEPVWMGLDGEFATLMPQR